MAGLTGQTEGARRGGGGGGADGATWRGPHGGADRGGGIDGGPDGWGGYTH
jgi:hypothetical protein